jgi:hypothetical protein
MVIGPEENKMRTRHVHVLIVPCTVGGSGEISNLLPVKFRGLAETGTASWVGLAPISDTWSCNKALWWQKAVAEGCA